MSSRMGEANVYLRESERLYGEISPAGGASSEPCKSATKQLETHSNDWCQLVLHRIHTKSLMDSPIVHVIIT